MNPSALGRRLATLVLTITSSIGASLALGGGPCAPAPPAPPIVAVDQPPSNWIYMRSRYTHDPATGARVAQYAMKPPVEPLDDPRLVTSGYSRSRIVIRGADGTADTTYRVTNFGNGRGGLDAEWERLHDAWRGSTVSSGGFGGFGGGFGFGTPYFGGGFPGFGFPGFRFPPGYNWQNGPLGLGPGYGFGPGYGAPDAGQLDPDGADGYHEILPRTPDKEFFNRHVPGAEARPL